MYSVPLFEKEGLGEIVKKNSPQSPFFKGGGLAINWFYKGVAEHFLLKSLVG